jgi:hypothetical protein
VGLWQYDLATRHFVATEQWKHLYGFPPDAPVREKRWILFSPGIPCWHSLFEKGNMFLIRHSISLLKWLQEEQRESLTKIP